MRQPFPSFTFTFIFCAPAPHSQRLKLDIDRLLSSFALNVKLRHYAMVKNASGKLKSATWEQALEAVAAKMGSIPAESMKAIAGKLSDAESVVALKDLFNRMGAGNTVVEGMEGRALTSVLTGCS